LISSGELYGFAMRATRCTREGKYLAPLPIVPGVVAYLGLAARFGPAPQSALL
jgi:precorrin-3B methylase